MKRRKMFLTAIVGAVFALAALGVRDGSTQTISTCQGVGCHGGSPGCYWYQAGDIQNIVYCYGTRP